MKWSVFVAAIKKLMEFFQDGTGAASATRLSQHMVVTTTLFLWIKACHAAHWTMVPFDHTHILLVATAVSGKVVQSFSENMGSNPPQQ